MGKCAIKHKQKWEDLTRDQSKVTCLIYGHGHSSYDYKVKNYFGTKYAKGRTFK